MSEENTPTPPKSDVNELVEIIRNKGRVDRITVSRTHKNARGDMFLSKSMNFSTGSEAGNPEGGLTLAESDVATMILSKDVEIDLVYRSLACGAIDRQQAETLKAAAETRFGKVTQYMAIKVPSQGDTP